MTKEFLKILGETNMSCLLIIHWIIFVMYDSHFTVHVKDLEALAGFNTQLQEEAERLKEEVSLIKRESKLSRKADKTGQDSLVMLNRELQQVLS